MFVLFFVFCYSVCCVLYFHAQGGRADFIKGILPCCNFSIFFKKIPRKSLPKKRNDEDNIFNRKLEFLSISVVSSFFEKKKTHTKNKDIQFLRSVEAGGHWQDVVSADLTEDVTVLDDTCSLVRVISGDLGEVAHLVGLAPFLCGVNGIFLESLVWLKGGAIFGLFSAILGVVSHTKVVLLFLCSLFWGFSGFYSP